LLTERIAHERELREAQSKAFEHERELRTLHDTHERELRRQVEDAVEKQHLAESTEVQRRLEDLNHAQERMERREAESVSREVYDTHLVEFEKVRTRLEVMAGQIAVWKGIAALLGVPGVISLLWALLAAANNVTVTGPGGFVHP
jgi:chromatin segregation and condensation protein Rec8/ScpA/Scc1 (kleisin family)